LIPQGETQLQYNTRSLSRKVVDSTRAVSSSPTTVHLNSVVTVASACYYDIKYTCNQHEVAIKVKLTRRIPLAPVLDQIATA